MRSPYYDDEGKIAITADAIIDNREELFKTLGVTHEEQQIVTDSQLIILAYKNGEKMSRIFNWRFHICYLG